MSQPFTEVRNRGIIYYTHSSIHSTVIFHEMVIKRIVTILFSQSGQHRFRKFLQDIEVVIFTIVVRFVKILSCKYKWGYNIGILVSVYSGRIYCTIWVILNVRLMSDLHNANSFIRIFC